ncbi:hypothetical protein IQ22_04222 [Pseudomonas duriflava]|uniref:Uncharacterized protein n=1 Tax=Pseudomonas duriflava TaxID=459528 RepID=A0A562PUE9_9PSED|nr:hypothetical protein [Pseudomonas duriflava]TWI48029.1 hypothetical protein IQ22_04222 [Pseudomonas duriflava]
MSSREEFEAWVVREGVARLTEQKPDLSQGTAEFIVREIALKRDGEGYQPQRTQQHWEGWQASRAALSVELPDVGISWPDDIDEGVKYREEYRQECIKALEAAGIEVQP